MKIENPGSGSREAKFKDGSTRNVTELETCFIGKGTYLSGWRWSEDVGSVTSKTYERHIGFVIEGSFGVSEPGGNEGIVGPGDAFELGPGADLGL